MKPKKINATLSLNKITVANLDRDEQLVILGGADTDPGSTCKTCPTIHTLCLPTTKCTGPYCPTEDASCDCWTHGPDFTCDTCH